jgi:hypothetical protein
MSDQNLSGLISAAVIARMTPDFIEKEVNSRVDKLIVESVDRALRGYSDTAKLIEKAVGDALRVDRLDLPSYGLAVTKILQAQIEANVSDLIAGRLSEDMTGLLSLAPKTIKLSEIAKDMLARHDSDAWGDLITVCVERTEYGSAWVYLDEDKHYDERVPRKCSVRLLLGKDGTISSASINDIDLKSRTQLGRAYGLEQKIRAYFACGTVIELDEDSVEIGRGDY